MTQRAGRRMQGKLSPKLQRVRAAKIVERKILGNVTLEQVAKEFNVGTSVVRQALTLAERADIVVKFEDKLYNELLPESFDAVREGLTGTGEIARAKLGVEIMKGTQVLRPSAQKSSIQQAEDDELALYVLAKRKQAAIMKETIDGEVNHQTANALQGSGNLLPSAKSNQDESSRAPENSKTGSKESETEAKS